MVEKIEEIVNRATDQKSMFDEKIAVRYARKFLQVAVRNRVWSSLHNYISTCCNSPDLRVAPRESIALRANGKVIFPRYRYNLFS